MGKKKFIYPLSNPLEQVAVIYARYSSSKQQEQSIEAQLRFCRAYAKQRGFRVIGEYCDRAISGREAETRPAFQKMVSDAKKGLFGTVIVWKLDRFSRNRYDSVIYKHQLRQCGVRVMSATEPVGEGSESAIVEALLEAMAEEYSRQLSQNVTRGMRESALKGQSAGGTIPLGYKVQDKKYVVDEAEARVVRKIFARYAEGATAEEIVAEVNEAGYTTRLGNHFRTQSIFKMLRNEKYIGVFHFNDGEIRIDGGCPAIITPDTWEAVQRRINAQKRAPGRAKAKEEYLLAGKVFCGLCGAPMVGESGKSKTGVVHHYYACAVKKRREGCHKRNEKKGFLEGYAVDQAVRYILHPDQLHVIAEAVATEYAKGCDDGSIKALEAEIRKVERELDACVDALIHAKVQRIIDGINAKAEALEAQRADMADELAGLKLSAKHPLSAEQVESWLRDFCTGDLSDMEFRKKIIDNLINAIYVFDDKIITYFNVSGSHQVGFAEMQESLEASESSDLVNSSPPEEYLSEPVVIFAAGVLGLVCPRIV